MSRIRGCLEATDYTNPDETPPPPSPDRALVINIHEGLVALFDRLPTGIERPEYDQPSDSRYFTIDGRPANPGPGAKGVFIKVTGGKAEKIVL